MANLRQASVNSKKVTKRSLDAKKNETFKKEVGRSILEFLISGADKMYARKKETEKRKKIVTS